MSPEQATGDRELDARSDVYALGAVLYELLTGDPPFIASSTQAVIAKLLTEHPTRLRVIRDTVPEHLETAVLRSLAKLPADRFSSAAELATALEAPIVEAAPSGTASVVVLPFVNRSPDAENEYFSDGLTEEIITDMSKLSSLRVISRNSAMQLKGTSKDTKTIGRELNVRNALTGTVRRAGDALRITVELVECETDASVWSDKYSGTVEDVFDLQERISRQIVDALQVVVTPEEGERLAARPISDVRAYECYLLARQELHRFTVDGARRAEQLLDRAIESAGENALLLACKAWAYTMRFLSASTDDTVLLEAERLLDRALVVDPGCATAYWVLGWMGFVDPSKVTSSSRNLHRALEIEPNNADALLWLSDFYAETGRPGPAIEFAHRAREVDPLSWLPHAKVVAAYFWSGRKEDAYREAEAMMANHRGQSTAEWVYAYFKLARQRRLDEMSALVQHWTAVSPADFLWQHLALLERALRGDRDGVLALSTPALEAWAGIAMQAPVFMAEAYALIGEVERAVDWLETSFQHGCTNYPYFAEYDDFLEPVRRDPRGQAFLERVRLAWENQE